jgi:rhodanese-related sulfurtransferase
LAVACELEEAVAEYKALSTGQLRIGASTTPETYLLPVILLYARLRDVAAHHLPDVAAAMLAYLGEDTEEVSRDELLRRVAAGHIPSAVSIPLGELAYRLADIPVDTDIVAYCRGAHCMLALEAVRLLARHGRHAARLADGMLEWRLAGLPVQTGTD